MKKIRIQKPKKQLLFLFLLIPILFLTLALISQPQRVLQFAQTATQSGSTAPPLFGCLQVGEGTNTSCASKLGVTTNYELLLHGRPLQNQTVYYGDRLNGSLSFTNVGNLPIDIQSLSIHAGPIKNKQYTVDFKPNQSATTLTSKQSVHIANTSHRFGIPDPNGEWQASTQLVTKDGSKIEQGEAKSKFTVNATCTALRINELTDKDKSNLKTYCAKNSTSKLCSSREYCEIFKGQGCTKPNIYKETPGIQCDNNVYLPPPEQDLLEELCKAYPDTDACKDFCARSVGSSLCPKKYIVIDIKTGKPIIRLSHTKAAYIHTLKDFPFEYPAAYKAKGYPQIDFSKPDAPAKVLGAKTNLLAQSPGQRIPKPAIGIGTVGNGSVGEKCTPSMAMVGDPRCKVNAPAPAPAPNLGCAAPKVLVGSTCVLPNDPVAKKALPAEPSKLTAGKIPAGLKLTQRNGTTSGGAPGTIFPCEPSANVKITSTTPLCTNPNSAEQGDEGYAPHCASKRQDVLDGDDPKGAPQFACCLDATKYVIGGGFCGTKSGAWIEPWDPPTRTTPGGAKCVIDPNTKLCSYADWFGKVCSNQSTVGPDGTICKGADRDPVTGQTREPSFNNIILPYQSKTYCKPGEIPDDTNNPQKGCHIGAIDGNGFQRYAGGDKDCNDRFGKTNPGTYAIKFPDGVSACVDPNPKKPCSASAVADVNGTCRQYCPLGQMPSEDSTKSGACVPSKGDWDGFSQENTGNFGTAQADCAANTTNGGKHLIVLPDGKTPMCVFNDNPCENKNQYKDAFPNKTAAATDGKDCKDYCPSGQIPSNGTCVSATDPGNIIPLQGKLGGTCTQGVKQGEQGSCSDPGTSCLTEPNNGLHTCQGENVKKGAKSTLCKYEGDRAATNACCKNACGNDGGVCHWATAGIDRWSITHTVYCGPIPKEGSEDIGSEQFDGKPNKAGQHCGAGLDECDGSSTCNTSSGLCESNAEHDGSPNAKGEHCGPGFDSCNSNFQCGQTSLTCVDLGPANKDK